MIQKVLINKNYMKCELSSSVTQLFLFQSNRIQRHWVCNYKLPFTHLMILLAVHCGRCLVK